MAGSLWQKRNNRMEPRTAARSWWVRGWCYQGKVAVDLEGCTAAGSAALIPEEHPLHWWDRTGSATRARMLSGSRLGGNISMSRNASMQQPSHAAVVPPAVSGQLAADAPV